MGVVRNASFRAIPLPPELEVEIADAVVPKEEWG